MIPKRITTTRRVVSRLDPAWAGVVKSKGSLQIFRDYCDTLDASPVLALQGIPESFSVFEVQPLRVNYEMFSNGEESNWWEIFRGHVVSISGMDLEKEGDRLTDKMHDSFGPDFVRDIADIIIKLANGDGQQLFFTHPVIAAESLNNSLRRLARVEAEAKDKALANTAAAMLNAQG